MRTIVRCFLLFGLVALVPGVAAAQATLAGEVKDTTGAVLPGVTVEAASPALTEKVRTAVTDGSGRYRIESLPPGSYTVTFALTGFAPQKREGLSVSGAGVITVDVELTVGGLAETITVTPRRRDESEQQETCGNGTHGDLGGSWPLCRTKPARDISAAVTTTVKGH